MQTRIQKWGNSLALRIPQALAESISLKDNSVVEIALIDEKLVISPTQSPKPSLTDLLAQITPENIHSEIDSGMAVGGEAW